MNIRRTAASILAAALTALVIAGPSPAHAAQPERECVYVGQFAGFMHNGDDLLATPFDWENTIHESRCATPRGIRYVRMVANTPAERAELVRMAKEDAKPRYPIAICERGERVTYALDLAYWYFAFVKTINHAERTRYADWVGGHAERHDCRLFS